MNNAERLSRILNGGVIDELVELSQVQLKALQKGLVLKNVPGAFVSERVVRSGQEQDLIFLKIPVIKQMLVTLPFHCLGRWRVLDESTIEIIPEGHAPMLIDLQETNRTKIFSLPLMTGTPLPNFFQIRLVKLSERQAEIYTEELSTQHLFLALKEQLHQKFEEFWQQNQYNRAKVLNKFRLLSSQPLNAQTNTFPKYLFDNLPWPPSFFFYQNLLYYVRMEFPKVSSNWQILLRSYFDTLCQTHKNQKLIHWLQTNTFTFDALTKQGGPPENLTKLSYRELLMLGGRTGTWFWQHRQHWLPLWLIGNRRS